LIFFRKKIKRLGKKIGEDIVHYFTKVKLLWRKHKIDNFKSYSFKECSCLNKCKPFQVNGKLIKQDRLQNKKPSLSQEQKDVIIGILIADGSLEKRKPNHNTRLRIDQTYPGQQAYVKFLYNLFKPLCGKEPVIFVRKPDKRTGKVYSSIAFKTYNLPCLNEFYTLFYQNSGQLHSKGDMRFTKIVLSNIQDLLTPMALAHWVMGDGFYTADKTVILCTESFSIDQIGLLINALSTKFGITAGIQKRVSSSASIGWRIRISKKSMEKFSALILPYILPEFKYKLGK